MATTPTFNNTFSIESEVQFDKTVTINEKLDVQKQIQAFAVVLGNSAVANATADAFGHDTTAQTLTQSSTSEQIGSAAQSESISATNNPMVHVTTG